MTVDVPELEPDDAEAAVADGALLLDVREPEEWDAGHAPGSVHMPLRDVQQRTGELPRDRRIVAICRSGARSRVVTEALVGAGFDAVNVIGGLKAWQAHGFDVVTDAGAPGVVA
jgi:rhodanese-related sulfurtransferase